MSQRETYRKGLAEIDQMFARFGISLQSQGGGSGHSGGGHGGGGQGSGTSATAGLPVKRGRGRPPGSGKKQQLAAMGSMPAASASRGKRKRRKFDQTADEFILGLLNGGKQMTTAEINRAWREGGRGGASDNTLGKLVSENRLKRAPVTDGRGSSYSAG